MIQAKKRREAEEDKATDFWMSYSDLMAGMLLIFVLLLIVAMSHYAEFNRRKQLILEAQETKLVSFRALQKKLIENLEQAFERESVRIDPATGILQIESGILFGEGEAALRAEGRERLGRIFDAYIRVILDDDFRDAVKQIEIEGHTNSNGTYLFNLELSQQRALTVMKELLARAGKDRDKLEQMVVAGGRSFSHLIYDERGREDMVRSRRIEIKFRLKETELFLDIYEELSR